MFLDVPLPGAFAVRPELISLGFGASKAAPHSLGLFAGALSLVYSFDDSEVQCLAAVGPLAGISVDDAAVGFRGGLLAAIGLRFAVAKAIDIEAKVSLPVVLYGPKGVSTPGQRAFADGSAVDFPLQTMFQLGVAVDLAAAVAALSP